MRLLELRKALDELGLNHEYTEIDGFGSVDFIYRELTYHVWEFEGGVETNVRNGGRFEDIYGDYESEIISIIRDWEAYSGLLGD